MQKRVKCSHCDQYPGFVSHSNSGGEVYSALECNCKSTPYYRSRLSAQATWHSKTFSMDPVLALKKMKEELI